MKKRLMLLKMCIMAVMCFATLLSQAQKKPGFIPPSIDDDEIPVVKTELPVPKEGKNYVVQYFKGITDGVESRIAIKNLGYIIRPAMVQVISEDGRELIIELVKKNWDDVVRSGKTKDGEYESSFKTAMEFGIKISAKEKGIPFIVAVSAGIELFPASNLFVDASSMRSSTASEETGIEAKESENSNSTLFIIIAIALIGILILLALLLFRKKGKGNASLIILFLVSLSAEAGSVLNLGNSLPGETITEMAEKLTEGLGNRYGRGDFAGDDPLSEDDSDFEPNPDPRGQPSLPSSCYEIARMGSSGSSSSSRNNAAGGGISDDNNNASSGGGATFTTGRPIGGLAGSAAGGDFDYEAERLRINNEYADEMAQVHEVYVTGMTKAGNDHATQAQLALEDFDRKFAQDPENVEWALQLQAELDEKNAQYAQEYEEQSASLENVQELDYSQAEQKKNDLLAALEERRANQDSDDNTDDEEEAEEGGTSLSEIGTPNSPTAPPDSDDSNDEELNERESENREGCRCLEEAYANLQKQRYRLEKLMIIAQHTKKITDFGISFGDDFSGIHGVSGLAWQKERAEIIKSIERFDNTYNNKYREIIDDLYNALLRIDECELLLGYENWYSHSGFIYYEFMKVRYASYK